MRSGIEHVSDTAIWVAFCRAQESARPDALISDPLAGKLVGSRGPEIASALSDLAPAMERWMGVRTSALDAMILRAIDEFGCDTVLNLAAGLDTRPYRLALPPSLLWYEADFPQLVEHKDAVLRDERPVCRLVRRALDLERASERAVLLDEVAGEGDRRILAISEGLLMYWSPATVGELAADMAARSGYRAWILDLLSPLALEHLHADFRAQLGPVRAALRFAPREGAGFFEAHGWKLREERRASLEAERLLGVSECDLARQWKAFYGTDDPVKVRDHYRFVLLERG